MPLTFFSAAFTKLLPKFGKANCHAFLALDTLILPKPYHDSKSFLRCSPTVRLIEKNSRARLVGKRS